MPQQLQLNLTGAELEDPVPGTHIEVLCGLTPWCLTSTYKPPYIGWWRTWTDDGKYQRRWWNGTDWSIPTPLDWSDTGFTENAKRILSRQPVGSVAWCGLAQPHPAGYLEYQLFKSPQLQHWEALHHKEEV